MTNAGELHQIAIPDGILCQHNEVISLLFFRLRIINRTIDDIHLVANNWLEVGSLTKLEQLDRAIHHTVIGERNSGHAQLLRPFHHRRQLRRPVKQAVIAVVVEGNKCHGPRLGPNARSSVSLHYQPPHLALLRHQWCLRALGQHISRLFVLVGNLQQTCLIEHIADQLHTDGQPRLTKTAGNTDRRQTSQIDWDR